VGEDQSDIGAGSASGQPLLNRSTRSGVLMKGRSDHADVLVNDSAGFTANNGTLPRRKAPAHVKASMTLGKTKLS